MTRNSTGCTLRRPSVWSGGRVRLGLIGVALTVSTAVAAPDALQSAAGVAKAWEGKTVVLTIRPRARFMSWNPLQSPLGLLAGAAAFAAGTRLVDENGIENPAPYIAKALFDAAEAHYGVTMAPVTPVSIDSTDPALIARKARGADLVFDVQPLRGSLEPLLTQVGRYFVTSDVTFRVIDVASAKVIGTSTCVRTSQRDPELPTKAELLADRAARLKGILDAQRDFCLEFFEIQVLGLAGFLSPG
jgi:hypothetical protein